MSYTIFHPSSLRQNRLHEARALDCACGRKVTGADDEALFRQLRRHVDRDHAHPAPARTDEELRASIAARGYTELLDDEDGITSAAVSCSAATAGKPRRARPVPAAGTPIEMVLAAHAAPVAAGRV